VGSVDRLIVALLPVLIVSCGGGAATPPDGGNDAAPEEDAQTASDATSDAEPVDLGVGADAEPIDDRPIGVCGNGIAERNELCDEGLGSRTCAEDCTVKPAVVAGTGHTCFLAPTGAVTCWGDNSFGQTAVPTGARFTQVSAGDWHTCGVKLDGTVACWGLKSSGQAFPPSDTFRWVSAGAYHTCGIRTVGSLACWGKGVKTTPCDPEARTYDCGQALPPPGAFTALDAGAFHNCALDAAGLVTCWGDNHFQQLKPRAGPTSNGYGPYAAISAGTLNACALDAAGRVTCWGDTSGVSLPPAAMGPVAIVSMGVLHQCFANAAGAVFCTGDNSFGQTDVPVFGSARALSLDASRSHTCAIVQGGGTTRVACWGAGATTLGTCDLSKAMYQCGQSRVPADLPPIAPR
jgi:alpha-tubulin suppressor-like RCC1 family protein